MADDLRQRYAAALKAAARACDGNCGLTEEACRQAHPVSWVGTARQGHADEVTWIEGTTTAVAEVCAAVRDTELEQLRFEGQNADVLHKDNAQLREEVTRLRINAEKDVCSGCMQREEQRDHWMESSRQLGVQLKQTKKSWHQMNERAQAAERELAEARKEIKEDAGIMRAWRRREAQAVARAEEAEAAIARVRDVHRVHRCAVDGHIHTRTPMPCVNNGVCGCGRRAPCPTIQALDASGDDPC